MEKLADKQGPGHFSLYSKIINGFLLIQKGEYVYVYDDLSDAVAEDGIYLISDKFPAVSNLNAVYPQTQYPNAVEEAVPNDLDAAMWKDQRLLFFKGPWVGTNS